MSTAPTVPAIPSRILDHAHVGELSTSLVVHAGFGPDRTIAAAFAVNFGCVTEPFATWSSHRYPFTADGERDARAKYAALVSAADVVQA